MKETYSRNPFCTAFATGVTDQCTFLKFLCGHTFWPAGLTQRPIELGQGEGGGRERGRTAAAAMLRFAQASLFLCAVLPTASAQATDAEWKLAHCGKRSETRCLLALQAFGARIAWRLEKILSQTLPHFRAGSASQPTRPFPSRSGLCIQPTGDLCFSKCRAQNNYRNA